MIVSPNTEGFETSGSGALPWELGSGQEEEPAFHRGWKLTLVLMFFVGYLLQYPVFALTGIFFIVFRSAASWYTKRALQEVEYRRRFSNRRTFPGEETVMTVEVANRKWLPLSWLAGVDHWAEELPISTSDGQALPNRPADLIILVLAARARAGGARLSDLSRKARDLSIWPHRH